MGSDDFGDLLRTPEEIRAEHQAELQKAEDLQLKIGEIVGTASSEDERIRVVFSEVDGIRELTVDPRAMRLPSDELAEEVKRLTNAAKSDGQAQIQKLLDETFNDGAAPDPAEVGEQVAELREMLDGFMQDTMRMDGELTGIFDRMRRMAGD